MVLTGSAAIVTSVCLQKHTVAVMMQLSRTFMRLVYIQVTGDDVRRAWKIAVIQPRTTLHACDSACSVRTYDMCDTSTIAKLCVTHVNCAIVFKNSDVAYVRSGDRCHSYKRMQQTITSTAV